MKVIIKPISFLNIQDSQKKKMELVLNPTGDGNCGFRCIAHAIYGDENLRMRVKQEIPQPNARSVGYIREEDVGHMLSNYDLTPPSNCWFDSIDCPQIVAEIYNRAVAVYSETAGNTLYLPFRNETPNEFRPIMLYLGQSNVQHWHLIAFEKKLGKLVWTSLSPLYEPVHISLGLNDNSILYKQ
ncbi:hypothetical protein RMCBS344292_18666 [Rhizopus microsporus]|nr:hypothetical protein RMCBS344292_18666 [Rhizopus microsporus]